MEDAKKKKEAALPTIDMPSFLGQNFEAFLLKFKELAIRTQGRYKLYPIQSIKESVVILPWTHTMRL